MITIGLIWLWLIDPAHSSILSTFLADLELSWIDWDLSSVAAELTLSPVSTFYPREAAVCAGAWLPGHDLTLVAIVIRRGQWARRGVVRDDIGGMRRGAWIWPISGKQWAGSGNTQRQGQNRDRPAGGWAEAKTVWGKETLWAWYHTRPAASDQMIYWASLSTKNRREMSVFWFRPNINTDDGSGQRAPRATGQLGAVSIHFKPLRLRPLQLLKNVSSLVKEIKGDAMVSFERNKACGCLSDNVYSPGPSVIWLLVARHFMTPMKQMSWHWHWHKTPAIPTPQTIKKCP